MSNTSIPLLPVIRVRSHSQLFVGLPGDSHSDIERRHHIHTWDDAQRGFTPDSGTTFLSRLQAADYIRTHDPFLYSYIRDQIEPGIGLHSTHLSPLTDLSHKSVLIIDKGLYLYLAERLAEDFERVYYWMPESSPYPKSPHSQIGSGLSSVIRIPPSDLYRYLDKVDLLCFFDIYEGGWQQWLREKGYRVLGSGLSESIETDRILFLDTLEKVDLPSIPTELIEGWDALGDYLRPRRNKWLKTPYFRGDFETKHYTTWRQFEPWYNRVRSKLGEVRSRDIPILVQDNLKSDAEVGYDGWRMNGRTTSNSPLGYEVKDKGLVARVFPFPPPIVDSVNRAMDEIFEERGYRNHYSTELRITNEDKGGRAYFIDPCCRPPSPPGELLSRYPNYSQIVWQLACGLLPTPQPPTEGEYGAEIVLSSSQHGADVDDAVGGEICVQFPSKFSSHIILKNYCRRDGAYYCIPNSNAGAFGNVVAWGKDMDEAINKVLEVVEEIECDGMEWNEGVFDDAEKAVEAGEKFGIKWED